VIIRECGIHFEEYQSGFLVEFKKNIYTEEYLRKLGLNERQIKAVDHIKENKMINLSSYKALIKNVSEKTLYRDLQDLVDKNILKEIGEKKGRKYELA
jgi:ATP-dependent DNA helicase RecG